MLYINEASDKAVELTIKEVGKDSPAGGMIKTLYEEIKRLRALNTEEINEEIGEIGLQDYLNALMREGSK